MIPQAYTTRDMSEAYIWLQTLPPTIREELKSMDQIVSLYLRAKRFGGVLPTAEEIGKNTRQQVQDEAPKSSQDFKKALKGLKHELEQFDYAEGSSQAGAQNQQHSNQQQTGSQQTAQQNTHHQASYNQDASPRAPEAQANSNGHRPVQTASSNHINGHIELTAVKAAPEAPLAQPATPNLLSSLRLDPKSRQIVNEIRDNLNLSSDMEVIRMSLVIAHKKLKDLSSN